MLSFIYYLYTFTICTIVLLLSALALLVTFPFDRRRVIVHELSRFLVKTFFAVPPHWKYSVEGTENIDPAKAYVIIINHSAMIDIPAFYFVPLQFRWVSKDAVFLFPFFGQFLLLHGDIAIKRGHASEAMRKVIMKGCKWLKRGVCVCIFPEGTRSKDGEIHRFKSGAFALAKAADVEVLPVVMTGTKTLIRPNYLFNWHNEIKIRILPPVTTDRINDTDQKILAEEVRGQMAAALNEIRAK